MSWQSIYIPGGDPEGKPIISVLAKRTYAIAPGTLKLSPQQLPLVEQEEFADPASPLYSDVVAETDLLVWKPTTDVVVLGSACTPRGKKAYHLDCGVSVGPLRKTIRAYGNRRVESKALRGLVLTDPEPFCEMPLGYAHAYGGTCVTKDGTTVTYYPNPIGKGFAIRGGFDDPSALQVPNLEDPDSPVTPDNIVLARFEEWEHAPRPASLGWTRRNFFPRYTYAGVLPEYLEAAQKNIKDRAKDDPRLDGYAVPRMDFRIYQGASDGLWGKQLIGNEAVLLSFLDPESQTVQFALPGELPAMSLDIGDGAKALTPVLHTVVIDMTQKLLSMVWRGALYYGGLEELARVPKLEMKVE